jgi:hypothetical protein
MTIADVMTGIVWVRSETQTGKNHTIPGCQFSLINGSVCHRPLTSGGPGWIPEEPMWWTGTGVSASTLALPNHYHSTNAPYTFIQPSINDLS